MKGWRWIMGLTRRARVEEGAGHEAARGGVLAVWRAMVQAAESEDRHGG